MNLIFKEYLEFLRDKNIPVNELGIKEGFYWLDRQIIKGYDKEGNLHKIIRLYIDDNLNLTYKKYDTKEFKIESWQETVKRNKSILNNLEKESLNIINEYIKKYNEYKIICPSSGGKDSSVTSYLVKQVENPLILFNNTSLDCAETYLHIKKERNLKVISPKEGFYQWRERNNFIPTRFSRACCTIFKEGAMVDALDKDEKHLLFMGMRNEESSTRANYKDEWNNIKWGNRDWKGILPIRKWSEVEIWLYMLWKNIEINKKYKYGYSRVGCAIACPFYSKSTWVLDKYWYPDMYARWHKILEKDFIENKKACIMNCSLKEYHINWNGGVVHDSASNDVIKEFAEQQRLDINIAKKYFDKTCMNCSKKLKKDDIALSMKYFGRQIEKFKCINCLAKSLNIKPKELKEKIKEFKQQGCALF